MLLVGNRVRLARAPTSLDVVPGVVGRLKAFAGATGFAPAARSFRFAARLRATLPLTPRPPLAIVLDAAPPFTFATTAPRCFPLAVRSRPPRAVAPSPPTLVIFPALSRVSRFAPRLAIRALGLLPPPPPGELANRPRLSRTYVRALATAINHCYISLPAAAPQYPATFASQPLPFASSDEYSALATRSPSRSGSIVATSLRPCRRASSSRSSAATCSASSSLSDGSIATGYRYPFLFDFAPSSTLGARLWLMPGSRRFSLAVGNLIACLSTRSASSCLRPCAFA